MERSNAIWRTEAATEAEWALAQADGVEPELARLCADIETALSSAGGMSAAGHARALGLVPTPWGDRSRHSLC